MIKIDDVIAIAQYLADKQNFLYIYLFSWTNEILLFPVLCHFVLFFYYHNLLLTENIHFKSNK